jgi:beta-glucanase (GH16 family)
MPTAQPQLCALRNCQSGWFLPAALFLCIGLAFLFSGRGTRSAAPQPTPPPAGYALVWSDEFEAADGSAPDRSKWTYDLGGGSWGNNELESYTDRPQNVQIKGGKLVITAQKETYAGLDGVKRNYTSARLKTKGLFAQAYGRFEARIKIPAGQGMWPAFWMLGEDIDTAGWPKCGEVDIMENIGKEPGQVHGSLHGPDSVKETSDLTASFTLPGGQKFADDFHVYAVEWEPGEVRFYVDSMQYATFTAVSRAAGVPREFQVPWDYRYSAWPTDGTWVFDHPFFLILNLAVGGDWPGPPDDTAVFPQHMLVDYVRVYKKNH